MSPPDGKPDQTPNALTNTPARPSGVYAKARPSPPFDAFPRDAGDPVARFLRQSLHADWPHLLIVTWIIYGPLEKLILPWLGKYLILGSDVIRWRPDVESLLTGYLEFPLFFAIYLWIGADIARVFKRLAENRAFANEARYLEFARRAQAAFSQSRWWVIGVVAAAAIVWVAHNLLWGKGAAVTPWFDDVRGPLFAPRVVSLALVGLVAYAVSQIIIRETLAIVWWRRMWRELGDDLVLHTYHPDAASGLGSIGNHAIGVSYCLLGMTLFVFMGSLLPSLRYGGNKIVYSSADTVKVSVGAVEGVRPDRAVTYDARRDANGRAKVVFRPRRMALEDAKVLHARISRLPSKAEALDTWITIDTVHKVVTPLRVSMYTNPEEFEIRLETVRTPLPAGIPTVRMLGVTLSVWNPLIAVQWVMLIAVVGLSLGLLLWPAHAAMEGALNSQLDALSDELDEHMASASTGLRTDPGKFAVAMDAVGRTKQVRTTLLEDCETWPLSKSLRRQLGLTSVLSIGSSLLNLIATGVLHLLRQLG